MAEAEESNVVELGFIEKTPYFLLRSKFFRCKIGGKPSWLSLENLPEPEDLVCESCCKPCVFLLQVYAPIDNEEDAFHRTVFIFMCPSDACSKKSKGSFAVFRSQLPRRNKFYDFEPSLEVEKGSGTPSAQEFQTLCDICGCKGIMKCETCDQRCYCSLTHRELDLKSGHKNACSSNTSKKKYKIRFLLPEYELVTDREPNAVQEKERSEEERMKEYNKFLKSEKAKGCIDDGQVDDLEVLIKKPDKTFNKFQKRVALEPEQVLRYQRGCSPLWVSSENTPKENDIPKCTCGAVRVFEFQVMPQMLNHLSFDGAESVDWGTLVVYTCSKSCNLGSSAYSKEFIWKQDYSDTL